MPFRWARQKWKHRAINTKRRMAALSLSHCITPADVNRLWQFWATTQTSAKRPLPLDQIASWPLFAGIRRSCETECIRRRHLRERRQGQTCPNKSPPVHWERALLQSLPSCWFFTKAPSFSLILWEGGRRGVEGEREGEKEREREGTWEGGREREREGERNCSR